MHIIGSVNIYILICICKSIGPCVSCVVLSVCDISNQSIVKATFVSNLP